MTHVWKPDRCDVIDTQMLVSGLYLDLTPFLSS